MEALNMEKMKKGGKPWKDEVLYASHWVLKKGPEKMAMVTEVPKTWGTMGCHLGQWSKSESKWLVRSRFCEVDPWCIYQSPMFFFMDGFLIDSSTTMHRIDLSSESMDLSPYIMTTHGILWRRWGGPSTRTRNMKPCWQSQGSKLKSQQPWIGCSDIHWSREYSARTHQIEPLEFFQNINKCSRNLQ